ncbi:hypothetical protein ACN47E_000726 [Coniothyrium glycines]
MRSLGVAFALAGFASAYQPALSSVSPNTPSHNPLAPVHPSVEACGVETVTVYETAYDGKGTGPKATSAKGDEHDVKATPYKGNDYEVKATPIRGSQYNAKPTSNAKYYASQYEARPTGKVAKPFGQNKEYFHANSEEDVKMKPCNHWDYNTKDPKNLVPKGKTQLYYAEGGSANAKPSNEFYFGVIDLEFKAPAVVLEHSSYIKNAKYANNELSVDFSTALACDFASESWKKGTIIVTASANCKVSSDDDQCYFKVDEVVKSSDGKTAVVKGRPQARDECTEGGEAHWGRYKPEKQKNATSSVSGFPSATKSYPGFSSTSSGAPHPTGYTLTTAGSETIYVSSTKSFGHDGVFTVHTNTLRPSKTDDFHGSHPTISPAPHSSVEQPTGYTLTTSGTETIYISSTESFGDDGLFTVHTSTIHATATDDFQGSHPTHSAEPHDDEDSVHSSATISSGVHSSETAHSILPSSTSGVEFPDEGDRPFKIDEPNVCEAPVDTKYNLPTTCLGEFFDLDLDEIVGYGELSAEDLEFLNMAMDGLDSGEWSGLTRRTDRRATMHRRLKVIGKIVSWGKKNIVQPVVSTLKTGAQVGVAIVKGGAELITTGQLSGSIKKDFDFSLPSGEAADAKQVDSPWGPAALIASYGTESKIKADKGVQREGYLNIFCVGCGAQGRVELAGSATWKVGSGITKGEIEAWADLKVAMKVGVDAQIKFTREWRKTLFQKGIPKLSFGPIILGPSIKVEARVSLEAGAEGRILAGAEMNWNRGYAKIDFIDPSKSTRQNFDPIGHPILEAEGELFVGAELGIPIGWHFGITVSRWSKTVGLINEPMVKGVAKAAVKAELIEGKISAGFTKTEGCQGIHANLSWRNKLTCNIVDLKEFTLLDSDYKRITSMCIPIGKQNPTDPATPVDPATPAEPETPTDPETPSTEAGENGEGSEPTTGGEAEVPSTGEGEQPTTGETAGEPTGENTTGEGAGEQTTPETPEGAGEGSEEPQKRALERRQTETEDSTSGTSEALPEGIIEVTDKVKSATNIVTYALSAVASHPYEREDGYIFTKLIAGDYNVMYCSNGNMYVKGATQAAELGCDDLFVYNADSIIGDGQGRFLYYHADSMRAAGVSRLRLGDEESPVQGTHAVALVPLTAEETGESIDADVAGLYVAADFVHELLFELVFCVYADGNAPRVFIVESLDQGIAVLESADVKYSITGGDVRKCYPLVAKEDAAKTDEWAEWDDSLDVDADGMEFEYDE